jgi:hypothetical protein
MKAKPEPEPEKVMDNSILTLLQNQRAGDLMEEASEGLRVLSKAVRATGKKGKLIIEVTIAPLTKGRGQAVAILDQVTVKAPQVEREMGIFFVTDEGDLSRNDPRQRELPLTAVERSDDMPDNLQPAQASVVG